MYGALLVFDSDFIHVVSISFSALIITELIMVAMTVHTWHWAMLLAQVSQHQLYSVELLNVFRHSRLGYMPYHWWFLINTLTGSLYSHGSSSLKLYLLQHLAVYHFMLLKRLDVNSRLQVMPKLIPPKHHGFSHCKLFGFQKCPVCKFLGFALSAFLLYISYRVLYNIAPFPFCDCLRAFMVTIYRFYCDIIFSQHLISYRIVFNQIIKLFINMVFIKEY